MNHALVKTNRHNETETENLNSWATPTFRNPMLHSILSYLTSPAARFAWVGALAAQLLAGLAPTAEAAPPPPLNGAKPRPFYAFAHNPNSISDVEEALKNGCNALEPDISKVKCDDYLVTWDTDLGQPGCGNLSLVEWCDKVNLLAQTHTNLALVVFDIKPPAALAANDVTILDAARNHLNANGVNLNVIYSTPSLDEGEVFNQMLGQLLPREGVQFDAMDNVADTVNYFFNHGYYDNIGYGDGTSLQYGPLTRAMDRAAFLRASVGYPKCVTYAYLLDLTVSMEHFINAGVDGLIVKDGNQDQLLDIVTNSHPELRLATREDNPFKPENEAYGLEFLTGSDGTDADIEFTLHGCKGSASITVTCHAEMGGKSSDPCSFVVTVADMQAPVITCPAPIVVNATSPAGAVVTFTPIATDNCGAPTIVSTPASGTVFPIGDTTVTSVAKDAAQNQAACTFNVHVKGAAEQTVDLLNAVTALNISKAGVKNSLIMQLNSVLASLQSNHLSSACGALQSFIDTINAQRNKSISTADADLLVAAANQIRAVIGCTP